MVLGGRLGRQAAVLVSPLRDRLAWRRLVLHPAPFRTSHAVHSAARFVVENKMGKPRDSLVLLGEEADADVIPGLHAA